MTTDLLINGEFISTKEKKPVINPANGEIISEVSIASENEVELALASARQAFDAGIWPTLSLTQRKDLLLKISQGILDKAGELAQLETLNTGKPIKESTFMDIPSAAAVFKEMANNFEKYLSTETISLPDEANCKAVREAQGVTLLIVPWNYPLLIACWKMASSLAAGNTVVLKSSSLTPLTVLELGRICHQAGLPGGVVNILNGSGEEIGRQLCQDGRLDLISFTGSNAVGKQIIEYSSGRIKKLILELGGKSASIFFADTDLTTAVNSALCSSFLNQGQMCTAMSRFLIEDEIYDKFIQDFVEKTKRLKLGVPEDFQTQMGPLISQDQRTKVLKFIEVARKEGAKILCGGKIPDAPLLKKGFFFEPTVISEAGPDSTIFKEEIFAPLVCINKFSTAKEAIKLTNDSQFGLAACVWTQDEAKAQKIAKQINAGIIWINTYGMFYPRVPYGGFKQSGFGKELGKEGFLEYTRLKSIMINRTPDKKPLVNYWYGYT